MGALLIYGFFSDRNRVFSLSVAALSKVIFVSLVLLYGQEFLNKVTAAIAMDCVVIILSGIYLLTVRLQRSAAS